MADAKPIKLASGVLTEFAADDTIPGSNLLQSMLDVSIQQVVNSTTETWILKSAIKGNTWLDGERIVMQWIARWKNISGASQTITVKLKYGSSAHTFCTDTISNSGAETRIGVKAIVTRVGSDLWVSGWDYSFGYAIEYHPAAVNAANGADLFASGKKGAIITAPGFSTDKDLGIYITLGAASTNLYYGADWAAVEKKRSRYV